MDVVETLRPKRRELVLAAEEAVRRMFATGKPEIKKTQLNHLIGVCGEAACAEEIENYIRYQAGRKGTGWRDVADVVIDEIDKALARLEADDRLRVEAFRLYAVFLTRAFTYWHAVKSPPTEPRRAREENRPAAPRERRP